MATLTTATHAAAPADPRDLVRAPAVLALLGLLLAVAGAWHLVASPDGQLEPLGPVGVAAPAMVLAGLAIAAAASHEVRRRRRARA